MTNQIQTYSDVLRIRSKFKRLQQLSWNISKIEQNFNIDQLDGKELVLLLETYQSLIGELALIYDELKNETRTRMGKGT